MRIGCGTVVATTLRWNAGVICGAMKKFIDEVIAIDYDITTKMTAHTTAGLRYGYRDSGITPVGTYSSPGRYFGIQVTAGAVQLL